MKLEHTEDINGDLCRTPGCRREPKYGALYCEPCRDEMEAEDYEARLGDAIDMAYERGREEGW